MLVNQGFYPPLSGYIQLYRTFFPSIELSSPAGRVACFGVTFSAALVVVKDWFGIRACDSDT